jgi:hypothetical protein
MARVHASVVVVRSGPLDVLLYGTLNEQFAIFLAILGTQKTKKLISA